MDVHIVKMYKDKEVNKNVKNIRDKISQQPENCENRNDPDLVQAFLKKWWVESDFKAANFPNIPPLTSSTVCYML
jgi:hypothetical protein